MRVHCIIGTRLFCKLGVMQPATTTVQCAMTITIIKRDQNKILNINFYVYREEDERAFFGTDKQAKIYILYLLDSTMRRMKSRIFINKRDNFCNFHLSSDIQQFMNKTRQRIFFHFIFRNEIAKNHFHWEFAFLCSRANERVSTGCCC